MWLTLGAAFVQNVRSLLQRQLSAAEAAPLTVLGATYVRFLYALPFAWLGAALLFADRPVPEAGPAFWLSSAIGGVAQVGGTAALLGSFRRRSFAVGTAFSKTEAMQTAAFGFVLLGDSLSWLAFAGILVSLVGVVVMTAQKSPEDRAHWQGGVGLGLLAGAGFAVAAVCYRGAALSLPAGAFFERAVATLAVALAVQTLAMGLLLRLWEPRTLTAVLAAWRPGAAVGAAGALASAGWFSAMTLQNAALVRALGQVELIFAFLTSVWLFRERVRWRDAVGGGLLLLGVALLVV
ncbi:MAG: hypothetical protein OXG51_01310 [Gammaproteobacteria bacterium]|nr:hypothetical protein [Gammaproteobacteria bacterium]